MGLDLLEFMLCQSGWYINVWDCHGRLVFGMGPKPEGFDDVYTYVDMDYFSVPVPKWLLPRITEKTKRKIEKWCWWVLENRGGAINWSGSYYVTVSELQKLEMILMKYSKPEHEPTLLSLYGDKHE